METGPGRSDIEADIGRLVRSLDGAADDDLGGDVDLFDYGHLDSFGIVGLIEHVDSRYGVDLSTVDFYEGRLRTIAGIAELISDRLAAGRRAG